LNYSPTQTGSTYTLVSGDVGNDVRCQVIASNGIGSPVTANSNQVDIPAPTVQRPINTVAPAITGNDYVGQVLTCSQGTWSNSPTGYNFQWLRGTTPIGTNSSTYTLVTADANATISCVVTATNAGGSEPQVGNSVYIYDADFKAVVLFAIAQSYTLPTTAQQQHFNRFVLDLKANSMWSIMDRFFVFANNGSSNFARINWLNPTVGTLATLVNSPTWSSNVGYVGNGTNMHIDTNYNPATQGVNYTLNNAGRYLFISSRNDTTNNLRFLDGNTAANDNCMAWSVSNNRNVINQGGTAQTASIATPQVGYHAIVRTASNATSRITDMPQNDTVASTAITSLNQLVLRSAGSYAAFGVGFYCIGAGIPAGDISTHRQIINRYLNNL
jgi:hypothetical protein